MIYDQVNWGKVVTSEEGFSLAWQSTPSLRHCEERQRLDVAIQEMKLSSSFSFEARDGKLVEIERGKLVEIET